MRNWRNTLVVVGFVLAGWAVSGLLAQEKPAATDPPKPKMDKKAKDIFYNPGTANQPATPAVQYKILLQRGAWVDFVPETFVFQKGDRMRLYFQGNIDGYLYVFNQGTSGKTTMLFPDKRIDGGKHNVAAHVDMCVPAEGWFEFDEKVGTEQLMLLLSPTKIDDLEKSVATTVSSGTPTLTAEVTVQVSTFTSKQAAAKKGKDLVYVEGQPPAQPASTGPAPAAPGLNSTTTSYVASDSGAMLFYTINLNHK